MTTAHISYRDLLQIEYLSDAIDLLTDMGAIGEEEISPFPLVPGPYKERLVGVPFLILEASIKPGLKDTEFIEMVIITTEHVKITLRDSSRGIFEQLKEIIQKRTEAGNPTPNKGFWVRNGLRVVENPYTDPITKIETTSKRYYLDI
jgi:hypothetical protein